MESMVEFEFMERVYRGKKVFVTGHTGFKGSWLIKTLSILGAEVKGYALDPLTSSDLYNLIEGDALCTSVIGDIRNLDKLEAEINSFRPDFIFHLAAQPLVRLSYEFPVETFEVNVMGTANVLESLRKYDGECVAVLITTDKVYYNNEWVYPYRESDRLGGYDPYSSSKACAELLIDSYRNSYFNLGSYENHKKSIAVARAGNVIGGGDWSKDRLIPDIVRSLSQSAEISVRSPNSVRPWQHVIEPVVGYLRLGAFMRKNPIKYSQAFNFGPIAEDALSVLDLLKLCIEIWGSGTYKVERDPNALHEAGLLKLDISKAASDLQWRPKLNVKESVRYTMNWYKVFIEGKIDISEFTEIQIRKYLNL